MRSDPQDVGRGPEEHVRCRGQAGNHPKAIGEDGWGRIEGMQEGSQRGVTVVQRGSGGQR